HHGILQGRNERDDQRDPVLQVRSIADDYKHFSQAGDDGVLRDPERAASDKIKSDGQADPSLHRKQ
ncbi:MAG: hypothetical protein ACYDDA_16155, partial [Acidiferrobacteraceae bacterium]